MSTTKESAANLGDEGLHHPSSLTDHFLAGGFLIMNL